MGIKVVVGADGIAREVPTTAADDAQAAIDAAAQQASQTAQALAAADQAQLNAILASPGSVVRGLALVVLDLANGKIPIGPATPYTVAQLVNLIQAKMR